MRPAWRLATSSLSERPSRSLLLLAVVAMAAMLIAAVGAALSSIRGAIEGRVEAFIGRGDLRIRAAGRNGLLEAGILDRVRGWPEVAVAGARLEAPLALRFGHAVWVEQKPQDGAPPAWKREVRVLSVSAVGFGIDPEVEPAIRPLKLVEGRLPARDDEIVLDAELARRLNERREASVNVGAAMAFLGGGAVPAPDKRGVGPETVLDGNEARDLTRRAALGVGDTVQFVRFQKEPAVLRVVGIAAQPPLGGNPQGYMTITGLGAMTGQERAISQVDVVLRPALRDAAQRIVDVHTGELPPGALLQTTQRVTSGLDRNLRTNQMGFILASTMSFLAAGFIIMTGMSTSVVERQRELGILRCIGASRGQLAGVQVLSGVLLGAGGGLVGVPLGLLAAGVLIEHYQDRLGAELRFDAWRIAFAFAGAIVAAVVGSAFPAFQASRVSPLTALASRAVAPRGRTILLISLAGLLGVALHLSIFTLLRGGNTIFFSYLSAGLPGLMLGYFCLGVPGILVAVRLAGPAIERLLGLPRHLLTRGVRATPYRFGFTAGAMMGGLALLVAIWTQGGATLRDWIDKIQFPDAFVVGFNLSPQSQKKLESLPFVRGTSSVALQPVETDAFGLTGMMKIKTFFIAFEPESFFRMNHLEWVQGDPVAAARRLEQGGAVIVAREFLIARGLGVGSTFTCRDSGGRDHAFEVVGVVTSPGLEIISDFFDVGVEFQDQRMHAVFGGRKDLKDAFGSDSVGMIQIALDDGVDDDTALARIREELIGSGVLNAGSGRQIKRDIVGFVGTTLKATSLIAVFALVVAGLGVANLIVAGIQSRQFEFGVLRAIGAPRRVLTRLVLGEALLVALTACVLGTLMGLQGAFGGARLNEVLWGLMITPRPPPGPIAAGWGFVLGVTLLAALPAVLWLSRRRPRDLLGAVKG